MEAGRELDAKVAEHVMGWKFRVKENNNPGFASVFPMGLWRMGNGHSTPDLPHFSTDIREAWEVAEKMKRDGWICFSVEVLPSGMHARFFSMDKAHGYALTDSVPLSICIAALRAVGVNVDELEKA